MPLPILLAPEKGLLVRQALVRQALQSGLVHTWASAGSLSAFMLLDPNIGEDLQTMLLINLYVCYTARNIVAHATRNNGSLRDCMEQLAQQAVFGHSKSRKVLSAFRRP